MGSVREIKSPLYPNYYPNNLECKWRITASKQYQVIEFIVPEFALTQPGDYLVVRDGPNEGAVVLKNFTEAPDPDVRIRSSGSQLWVTFKSDQEYCNRGFLLKFIFVNTLTTTGM